MQLFLTNPVVEEYDEGIWHVVKYANGRAECWGREKLENVAFTEAGPYGGYMAPARSVALPLTFVAEPVAFVSGDTTHQIVVGYVIARTSEIACRIYNSSPGNFSAQLNYYAAGKWK